MKWLVAAVVKVPDSPQAQLRRRPTIYYSRRRRISMALALAQLLAAGVFVFGLKTMSKMGPKMLKLQKD